MLSLNDGETVVLASASPRRRDLLQSLGLEVQISPADIDESHHDELPEELVKRLAFQKASLVAEKFPSAWVVGGDTTVVCDGEILEKPEDEVDARRMLELLSGKTHSVLGGLAVVQKERGLSEAFVSETKVHFQELDSWMIERYIETKEPFGKAGGYAIQGNAQAFVKEISGSYTNVVGMDVPRLVQLLVELGVIRAS